VNNGMVDPVRPLPPGKPPEAAEWSLFAVSRRTLHSHPLLVDSLLALALLAFSTFWLAHSTFAGRNAALIQTALIVPLAWRRVHPTVVFLSVSAVALGQLLLGYQLIGDVALLVALYTVAVHESRVRAAGATGLLEVGALLAALRWEPAGSLLRSLLFLSATVVAALFAGLTVASGSRYLAWLAERAQRLEIERDQQATIAATAERTRIAREMHDIISHSLSVVITLADAASVVTETDPARGAEAMAQVSEVGRQALADMRAMIGVLRADESAAELAPQPDLGQLATLVDRVRATGLAVDLVTEGSAELVGASAALTVYRVVQEALTNTLKHAGASRARVLVRYRRSIVDVHVLDDGRAPMPARAGHGIEGMHERVALHGGSLAVGPSAEGGWIVSATLPLQPHPVPA
jgi:signal transduction histidine kinase